MNEKIEMHAIAVGTVQGVGFRYTVQQFAQQFHVTGTVQNLPDGSVEIYAQGSKNNLDEFSQKIRSYFREHIADLSVEFRAGNQSFSDFKIISSFPRMDRRN
jgi:acylphosphatase